MFFIWREGAFRKASFLAFIFLIAGSFSNLYAQSEVAAVKSNDESALNNEREVSKPLVVSVLAKYFNEQDGLTSADLIERALQGNGELVSVRIEIEKAKARLRQARLRPNPTLEIEQTTGRFTGSPGDGELGIGLELPLELYGRRKSRIELAEIDIKAREAEVANFERRVAADVLLNYGEALAALREIEILEKLLDLDLQTARFVQIRVNEGETPPLELSVLQVEVERLRSKKELAKGQLQTALTKLKLIAGLSFDTPLLLCEDISKPILPQIPTSIETAISVALQKRPDVLLARIEEDLAMAGLRLVRAQSRPDFAAFTRYTQGRAIYDDPNGAFAQRDRSLTFGVSIGLPVFNRNQGAKAEAELAIKQAQAKRDFAEKVVRSEVITAFMRIEAAQRALMTLQTGVMFRSEENVRVFRQVYAIGEIKITDLINEQRRLLDANRDLTEALTERYRAQADLLTALGPISFK